MISDGVYVRARQDGDRLHPAGRRCGKTLKSLFQEAKVPPEQRWRVPLLCDEQGILLVTGLAVEQRAAVTPQTTRILWMEKQPRKDCQKDVNA